MATEILAVGASTANSSDVTVAANEFLTVAMKDTAGPTYESEAKVAVQIKDDAGQYFNVDQLSSSRPALVLAAGTYRFARRAGGSCGVFSG